MCSVECIFLPLFFISIFNFFCFSVHFFLLSFIIIFHAFALSIFLPLFVHLFFCLIFLSSRLLSPFLFIIFISFLPFFISCSLFNNQFILTAHIFFDDAMTLDDDEEFIPNDYVKMVVDVMEEAVR